MPVQASFMLQKKDQLFRVIATLQASEKAYFKKYAYKSSPDSKKESEAVELFVLFDLIDKQLKKRGVIEEEELLQLFTKKCKTSSNFKNYYTKLKSRLFHLILDTLREYDKNKNEVGKIFDLIASADSLSRRKLFYDAKNILQKAGKIAEDLEQIELLIYIKIKIHFFNLNIENYGKPNPQKKEWNNFEEVLHNISKLNQRANDLSAIYRLLEFQKSIGVPRSKEDFEQLKEIQNHPSFQLDYTPQLNISKIELATALCGIYFALGDVQNVVKIGEKFIQEYQPNPKLEKIFIIKYLSLYDSLLQGTLLSLNVSLFEKYYIRFKEVKTFDEVERNHKSTLDLYLQSMYAFVSKKTALIYDLSEAFDLVKEKAYIPNYRKISLTYYMIFGHFLEEDYDQSLHFILWLKAHKSLGIRYDVEIAALTMECIILIKKEEYDLLEYRLRSFYEFLKNRERIFLMESALMRLLKKIINSKGKLALRKGMEESLLSMRKIIEENPNEKTFLNGFDIISWLESEINNKTFKTVYYKNNIE